MEQVKARRRNSKIIIIINPLQNFHTSNSKYLLALHSCSESFGIAVKDLENRKPEIKRRIFHTGRSLSNKLLSCVDTLLPKKFWKQIVRISVVTGPGSFTSTRLTLSMARTISQQIDCSLDAISSFHLMAPRLQKYLPKKNIFAPFWIKDILPRRGVLAGKYQLKEIHKKSEFHEYIELLSPQLINNEIDLNPSINASDDLEKDIISLINYSQFHHDKRINSKWDKALPIYPTSPVDNKKPPEF